MPSKRDLAVALRRCLIDHERRTGRRVKKSTLAKLAGVSTSSMYAYLNGTTLPSVEVLDRVLGLLDVPVAERRALSTARDMLDLGRGNSDAVPRQLPSVDRHFVGRAEELGALNRLLDQTDHAAVVIAAVGGTAGIGKTALAVHWAHQVQDRFPDGQLYVNMRGSNAGAPLDASQALQGVLQTLGVAVHAIPGEEDSRAALYRSLLVGRRVLVLLDNALNDRQVRPLLPGSSGCLVVITSRATLATMDGAQHLHLHVLSDRDASTLLGRLAGEDRVRQEPEAADQVVRLCARLPLAVRIAGARLAARPDWPIHAFAGRLADARHRLDELQVTDRALRASFAVSHRTLLDSEDSIDQAAARMFRLLGALDWVEMSIPVAAALADVHPRRARATLERLVDDHLLDSPRPGRYQTHDLLRLYAGELAAGDEPEREAAQGRALNRYLVAATQGTLLLHPVENRRIPSDSAGIDSGFRMSSTADARAWTDAERANLVAAVRQAMTSQPALAIQLAAALYRPFDACGYWHDHLGIRRLAAQTASTVGDRHAEALAREDIGRVCSQLGLATEAIAEGTKALAITQELRDSLGEACCLGSLAGIYKLQGRLNEAVNCFEQALRRLGGRSHNLQSHILINLGLVYQRLGRVDEAISCQRRALASCQELGDRLGEAAALSNVAWVYSGAGRADDAATGHQQGLAMFREIGHRYGEAEQLWGLGLARDALGERDQARACWHESIGILRAIGFIDPDRAAVLLGQDVPEMPEIIRNNI